MVDTNVKRDINFLRAEIIRKKKMAAASVRDVFLLRGWLQFLLSSLPGSFNGTGRLESYHRIESKNRYLQKPRGRKKVDQIVRYHFLAIFVTTRSCGRTGGCNLNALPTKFQEKCRFFSKSYLDLSYSFDIIDVLDLS